MWSKKFWAETVERVVKTFAQTFGALLVGDSALPHVHASVAAKLAMAGMAALASLLTSVGGVTIGADNSPAWLPEELDPPGAKPKTRRRDSGLTVVGVVLIVVIVLFALGLGIGAHPLWFLLLLLCLVVVLL